MPVACYCGGILEPCQDSVEPNVTRLRCSRQCTPPRRRQSPEKVRKLVREEALLSASLAQHGEEEDGLLDCE